MKARRRYNLVLAVYPSTRGFAFVVFEGSLSPVDWSVREVRGRHKNQRCLVGIVAVLERYRPDVLVLQDMSPTGTRRAHRLRELNASIRELAEDWGIPVYAYSRAQVREAFEPFGLANKRSIAETIAKHIPAFDQYLPPIRKPWMSEDARMGLFDAAALALTFFNSTVDGRQDAG
jgi:Holliday junction resolvasome RuvABC endonuclease subunit